MFLPQLTLAHEAAIQHDLTAAQLFMHTAPAGLAEEARASLAPMPLPQCLPFPLVVVLQMQRLRRLAAGLPEVGADLAEARSLQCLLGWNGVVTTVSACTAEAYRGHALPERLRLSTITGAGHQVHYVAHAVKGQGWRIDGYWVLFDLHLTTRQPLLVILPVALDPRTGERRPVPPLRHFTVPLAGTWPQAVQAAADEQLQAPGVEGLVAARRYSESAAAWQPAVVMLRDLLGGAAYHRACAQGVASGQRLRHVVVHGDGNTPLSVRGFS